MVCFAGYACAEYNQKGNVVQPNYQKMCNGPDFEPPCPFNYPSTHMYICKCASIYCVFIHFKFCGIIKSRRVYY